MTTTLLWHGALNVHTYLVRNKALGKVKPDFCFEKLSCSEKIQKYMNIFPKIYYFLTYLGKTFLKEYKNLLTKKRPFLSQNSATWFITILCVYAFLLLNLFWKVAKKPNANWRVWFWKINHYGLKIGGKCEESSFPSSS